MMYPQYKYAYDRRVKGIWKQCFANWFLQQATSARSPSVSSYDDAVEDISAETSGVVRSRLETSQARTRFRPARVDARNVDFSGRLGQSNQSYKASSRRHRAGSVAGEDDGYGDFSDDEDETLDRKLARLKREVEGMKIELEQAAQNKTGNESQDGSKSGGTVTQEQTMADVTRLSEALDSIYFQRHGRLRNAQADFARILESSGQHNGTIGFRSQTAEEIQVADDPKQIPDLDPHLAQALFKTAEFESRLTFLEASLGLNGSNMPDQGNTPSKPIIPSLSVIDRQLQTIANMPSSLENAHNKTRQLIKDAERLERLRAANDDGATNPPPTGTLINGHGSHMDTPEKASKINALYGTLATIDSLSPTLPMVLERLRTLRALHTSAVTASTALDDIEKRQAEQAAEIGQWREALQKVESYVKDGQSSLKENVEEVDTWVKELEDRLTRFS